MLFVAEFEVLLQAFDITSQALVLFSQLCVEVLLEVKVTLHVVDLAVPEVKFVALLAIVLLHECHSSGYVFLFAVLLPDIVLQQLNSAL